MMMAPHWVRRSWCLCHSAVIGCAGSALFLAVLLLQEASVYVVCVSAWAVTVVLMLLHHTDKVHTQRPHWPLCELWLCAHCELLVCISFCVHTSQLHHLLKHHSGCLCAHPPRTLRVLEKGLGESNGQFFLCCIQMYVCVSVSVRFTEGLWASFLVVVFLGIGTDGQID